VLAGLHKAGFVPEDAEHIHYFRLPEYPTPPAPPDQKPVDAQHIGYIRMPEHPALPAPPDQKPAPPDRPLPVVPYESFLGADAQGAHRTVLLWLDETDVLGHSPLSNFERLAFFLRTGDGKWATNVQFTILGPNTSDILHDMEKEASSVGPPPGATD
jgi:hypothetical protein